MQLDYLYDYDTGECLGTATEEQDGEGMAQGYGNPFLILWDKSSPLHGRVLDGEAMPSAFNSTRRVCTWPGSNYYRGRGRIWHYTV